ncbi:uncharacterized protein LOC143301466 isoform X4 [Babylonia areolata]|uniref:uncharacterized protein LOC143301466 isoform X4 n=1 Tax=Babylonia areolata TaxID=304850 RepID=UPI003FD684D0
MNMWWKSFATVLLVTCLYDKVFGADQVFQCPDSFIDGEVNSLTVQVNKTAMEKAQCEVPPRLFNFIRKRTSDDPEASSTILCRIQYSCSNPGPVSEPSNKENVQCGCVQKSQDNILTFEMKFYPNETLDTGARFSYTLCVSPIHPPTKVESDSCSSASFAVPEENGGVGGGCGGGCIGGIIGALVGVLVTGIIAFVVVRRRRGNDRSPVCTREV